jgi:hypothetical protein
MAKGGKQQQLAATPPLTAGSGGEVGRKGKKDREGLRGLGFLLGACSLGRCNHRVRARTKQGFRRAGILITVRPRRVVMPRVVSDWRDLITAARRKLEIATFHLGRLRAELKSPGLGGSELPPIPVQAHFEGVLIALMAAVDQVAEATNFALRLGLRPAGLVAGAATELGNRLPDVRSWFGQEIYSDLRRIRVRAVHYTYTKSPSLARWRVESAETSYRGSRELLEYATAGVEHGKQFACLLNSIESELAASRAGS